MALESATYVSDLVATNPTAADPKSQGDDHLRLLKSTLQTTFPEASAPIYGLRAAAAASASGTSVDFTAIPAWVRRITIQVSGLSTNGTAAPLFQLGNSGGVEVTNYLGTSATITSASTSSVALSDGFSLNLSSAASVIHGCLVLSLVGSNTWVASGNFSLSNTASNQVVSGAKALSATLDRVRITTATGVDTFDAGTVNVLYE